MGSSRFPGKPLAQILGVPMVGHVFFRTRMSSVLDEVCVATCDREIAEYVTSIGGRAVMTSEAHERASDRVAEAADILEREGMMIENVVLIQGDEPMLEPNMIAESLTPLSVEPAVQVTNLLGRLKDPEEHRDLNEIKVVVDKNSDALYFSREPIPSAWRSYRDLPLYKQICIISFRRKFLSTFARLPQTPLEKVESIDMLRVLEHGFKVRMVPTATDVYSVDTEQDLREVETLMSADPLVRQYAHENLRYQR